MKKIRIDYYRYRIRKGRVDVLIQKTGNPDEFCIPYRYVEESEKIAWTIKRHDIEDDADGDLVITDYTLNDCHLKKENREWVPLNNILNTRLLRNESYHVYSNILKFFLLLCPDEPGICGKVLEMTETVKINIAKKEYVDSLRKALERKNWVVPDAHMTPPDPELIKREIETLEHFRWPYEAIDWEVFGAKVKSFPWLFRENQIEP